MRQEFSQQIFYKIWNAKFIQNRSVAPELFHVDGRTDMTKLTVAFRNSETRLI